MLLICVWEFLGSDIGWDAGYPTDIFGGFPGHLNSTLNRPRSLPSISFPIYQSFHHCMLYSIDIIKLCKIKLYRIHDRVCH